jgi:hypothetical protein
MYFLQVEAATVVMVFTPMQAPTVYIISTVPAAMAVTTPEAFTVAMLVLELLQVPPLRLELNDAPDPTFILALPVTIGVVHVGGTTLHPLLL